MIKNIMGTVLAIAVAFGAGTNMSHATPHNNTAKIVKASGSTTLSDHHAKVRFTRSSDSYLGNGTIKRPIGVIITVSTNK